MTKLKRDIQAILHPEEIKEEDLHPPRAPTPTMIDVAQKRLEYGDINFQMIANSSEFKRFVYFIYTGKTHRGTLEKLDNDIKQIKDNVEIVRAMPKEVLAELKEKIKKRYVE